MMLLRRFAVAAACAVVLGVAAPAAPAAPVRAGDHLTVTITRGPQFNGTYRLDCHPAGGTHPRAQAACDQLDRLTRWGRDPFAPVPPGQVCTYVYGGPHRAHVKGSWAGRPVNARFSRSDGCEIARWNRFSQLLGR